jgi:hypothetical protein
MLHSVGNVGLTAGHTIPMINKRLTVTRRVSPAEQELITYPEHLGSLTLFSEVRVARSSVFCVGFCRSLFVLFLWTVVLSVFLRFPAYDYHYGIFTSFLYLLATACKHSLSYSTRSLKIPCKMSAFFSFDLFYGLYNRM